MTNRAWVTLATNDSYGLGALVLAHSLRRVASTYPAVVLITPSVTDAMRERLQAVFAEVITVDVLDSQDAAHLALLQRPELGITFTKIHCWNLTQYEKCVFLDADILVVQNCDELFEREELTAAPDVGWPDCFNSGVFVFRPSSDTFSRLITFAQERGSFDGGDQGLLNSFFSDWSSDNNKRLPFLYNVTSGAFYSYLPALKHFGQNLKIIHFIGPAKPWLQHYNFESQSVDAPEHLKGFLQLWWDLFTSQVHTQLDVTMANLEEPSPETRRDIEESHLSEFPFDIEQRLDFATYEPELDSTSEFPWHHPDNQILESDSIELDKNDFFDPWDLYRGNILPNLEDSRQSLGEPDPGEVRKYAWDHSQHVSQELSSKEHMNDFNPRITTHDNFQNNQLYENKINHIYKQNENYNTQNFCSNHNHIDHISSTYSNTDHYTCKEPQNIYISNNFPLESNENNSYEINKSHTDTLPSQINHNKIHQVYCVHMDSEKPTQKQTNEDVNHNELLNGDVFDESHYDDVRPRHPYDGFYLRHKMTIDSHGKKMCTHEIPPLSPSPPPEISENYEDEVDEIENGFYLDTEDETGVAGNLARVQPGVPLQHEAIDELSRRQGWESGNIDYMGADSFANIWAKISQTLNQGTNSPPKQPSPPKECYQAPLEKTNEPVNDLAEKVAGTSLDESNDIPIPAREAAHATGKTSDFSPEIDQKIEGNVTSSNLETIPQLESMSSVTKVEVNTETSSAPLETMVADNQSFITSPDEVNSEVEASMNVSKKESESITSINMHEAKSLEPKSPITSTEMHENEPKNENDSPISNVISEQSTDVHVPEPMPETPYESSTQKEPIVNVPESTTEAPSEALPDTSKDGTTLIQSDLHESKVAPAAGSEPKPVSKSANDSKVEVESLAELNKSKTSEAVDATTVLTLLPQKTDTDDTTEPEPRIVQDAIVAPVPEVIKTQAPEIPYDVPTVDPKPVIPADTPKAESDSVPKVPEQNKTPEKADAHVSDSPPLANTPSQEAAPSVPATKLEERRKPAAKLQLKPPTVADPLPTPDSELEDAATLAQSIIASELRTPTVTSPSPTSCLASPQLQTQQQRLDVKKPDVPTPPVGAVSLSQIGIKPKAKPTTASQIESSVTEKTEAEPPKKKVVKKVVKKDGAPSGEAPVPPPRKKEKKPKEK